MDMTSLTGLVTAAPAISSTIDISQFLMEIMREMLSFFLPNDIIGYVSTIHTVQHSVGTPSNGIFQIPHFVDNRTSPTISFNETLFSSK